MATGDYGGESQRTYVQTESSLGFLPVDFLDPPGHVHIGVGAKESRDLLARCPVKGGAEAK